jgi:glycosyltransferase involved in cell wall biosynthesis
LVRRCALIPAFNEAHSIVPVLKGLRAVLPQIGILVVDDGSTDGTGELALEAGAQVLRLERGGYARALTAGYRHLLGQSVEQVIQLDGDGQHPPEEAPRLLAYLDQANWIVGSRANTRSPAPFSRRLGNAALAGAVRALTQVPLQDVTSGFWALDQKALELFATHFPQDVADANIRVMAARKGLVICEHPVQMSSRQEGESMHDGLAGFSNWGRSVMAVWRASRVENSARS